MSRTTLDVVNVAYRTRLRLTSGRPGGYHGNLRSVLLMSEE